MKARQKLEVWWEETSANVTVKPTPLSRIQELESRYSIRLPDDFKEYLLNSCPLDDSWDDNSSTWWHFDRVKNIPEEYKHAVRNPLIAAHAGKYLFFADHSIWCWAWAISCTEDENRGKVVLIDGARDHSVADSFIEFVQQYISDFRSVC